MQPEVEEGKVELPFWLLYCVSNTYLARNKLQQISSVSQPYPKGHYYWKSSSSSVSDPTSHTFQQCFSCYSSRPAVTYTVHSQSAGVYRKATANHVEAMEAILAFQCLFQCRQEGRKVSAACEGGSYQPQAGSPQLWDTRESVLLSWSLSVAVLWNVLSVTSWFSYFPRHWVNYTCSRKSHYSSWSWPLLCQLAGSQGHHKTHVVYVLCDGTIHHHPLFLLLP